MNQFTYTITTRQMKYLFHFYVDLQEVGIVEYMYFGNGYARILHTELISGFEGKCYGTKVVLEIIRFLELEKKKIIFDCPFARKVAIDNDKIVNVSYDDFEL